MNFKKRNSTIYSFNTYEVEENELPGSPGGYFSLLPSYKFLNVIRIFNHPRLDGDGKFQLASLRSYNLLTKAQTKIIFKSTKEIFLKNNFIYCLDDCLFFIDNLHKPTIYMKNLLKNDEVVKPLHDSGDKPSFATSILLSSTMDYDNKLLYIIHGSTLYRLDLKCNVWTLLDDGIDLLDREGHGIVLYNSKLILVGGSSGIQSEFVNQFKELPVFDLNTKEWSKMYPKRDQHKKPSYPSRRHSFSGVFVPPDEINDACYIVSGGKDSCFLRDIWTLNLHREEWHKWRIKIPLHIQLMPICTATPQGQFMIFAPKANSKYSKLFTCWFRIPNLSEIAWQALIFYQPGLLTKSAGELRKLGILQSFVDRT